MRPATNRARETRRVSGIVLAAVSRYRCDNGKSISNPSLCSAAKLDALAEDVDDFSLSFVTPLGAEYDDGRHCGVDCV
jgi:hypothetical protein